MTKSLLILICFFLSVISTYGQNSKVDSLLSILKKAKEDSNKVITLNYLFLQFEFEDDEKARDYLNKALVLSQKINYKNGVALTYINLGFFAEDKGDYMVALKNYFASLKIRKETGDQKGIADSYSCIGIVYDNQGNYPEALKNHFNSLKIYEAIGNKEGIANCYNNIGIINDNQGNYLEALKNHQASLKIEQEKGDQDGIANSYINIGIAYKNQSNYSEALKMYFAALKIMEAIGNKLGMAYSYNNIGNVYSDQSNYKEALKYYISALKLRESVGDKAGITASYCNLGNILIYQKRYIEAEDYLIKAKELSIEIGFKEYSKYAYRYLTKLDSAKGNYKGAFENQKLFTLYRDSLDNEETRKKTVQAQMTYEFEKKEAVSNAEHKKEIENQKILSEGKSRKQKIIIGFVGIGLILVLVFAGFVFRSLRITRRQKQMIETQKDEIEAQRDLVTEQKEHIEEIHQEVTDSIQYARRIQHAVLPNLELLLTTGNQPCLPAGRYSVNGNQSSDYLLPITDYFILFKPKDIVSGDFYFVEKRKNMLFIAVADCTGHGVPGAFMSMLGISFLNEIIVKEEVKSADHVLNLLREQIIRSLQQKGISGEQKDGMDIAFCAINTETLEMQFAGANNPIYIITQFENLEMNQFGNKKPKDIASGEPFPNFQIDSFPNLVEPVSEQSDSEPVELVELKGDKQPIGIHSNMQPFTNQLYQLKQGDTIYLLSDGYEDQFGGPNRKKFLAKNLKNLLTANSQQLMAIQKQTLETTIIEWIGHVEQIDDITILGFKII